MMLLFSNLLPITQLNLRIYIVLPILVNMLILTPVYARTLPDAGSLLPNLNVETLRPLDTEAVTNMPDNNPVPLAEIGMHVMIRSIHITGSTIFDNDKLQEVIFPIFNSRREYSFAELQAITELITLFYKKNGYSLSRAYLPEQTVEDETIEIRIVEGRISKINLNNISSQENFQVLDYLSGINHNILNDYNLERCLLILNDLPYLDVQAIIKSGVSTGTSELDLQVMNKGKLLSGNISLDNEGNQYSGKNRLNLNANVQEPLNIGDSLDLKFVGSTGSGYSYKRAAWQKPIGSEGLSLGLAYTRMDYQLNGTFKPLEALGSAKISNVYIAYPLIRSRFSNIGLQLSFDNKILNDRVDATFSDLTKRLNVYQLGLVGNNYDSFLGGGINNWSVNMVIGHLSLDPSTEEADAATIKTEGSYRKETFQLSRVQKITDNWSLVGQVSGQYAHKNLDSSEKLSLGGSSGVRAYAQGTASVDDGVLFTTALRYTVQDNWQVSIFYDIASGNSLHTSNKISNTKYNLSGVGMGIQYMGLKNKLSFQTSVAHSIGNRDFSLAGDQHIQAWMKLQYAF